MTETPENADEALPRWIQLRTTIIRRRTALEAFVDLLAWTLGMYFAVGMRFESPYPADWRSVELNSVFAAAIVVGLLQLVIGTARGLYRLRWRYGSFDEISQLGVVVALSTASFAGLNATVFDRIVPSSVPFMASALALILMTGSRYFWRLNLERSMRPSLELAERVIVFGAGEGGIGLITGMMRNPESPYVPVALLDDHPSKRNLSIMSIPVLGGRHDMDRIARELDVTTLIIAIPSAESELLRDLSQFALDAKLEVKVVPALKDLLEGAPRIGDVRPISEIDLLGRHQIDTDIASISGYITGKRVLVTGAGGSIGSELCYQLAQFAPAELVMLDRDESALHSVQLRIEGRAMLDTRNLAVCDIRDSHALDLIFDEHRPQVVFHTAALKHLPLLEMHPREALKTNVYGTHNLLEASQRVKVERFVNISTDKAADPTSVLGYTKRIAERLTARKATQATGTYLSVRFGNVLGSRGSVLTAFRRQIEAGGPVTVTHRDVTRYFMTVEEAVQLVIQAGAVGDDGEALVLDMGEPVRIADVARRLVAQADRPIEIVFTGLRPAEKLHEVLFSSDEADHRPKHPLISHCTVPDLEISDVDALAKDLSGAELIDALVMLTNFEVGSHTS